MKRVLLLTLLWAVAVRASPPEPSEEIAKRSGLPLDEVSALLSDCDASQTSMNFCAWRDLIVAEQELQRVVAEKHAASPACKYVSEADIARWKKTRDRACQKSAQKEWGSGSMEPTAHAVCATAETTRMTAEIRASKCD